MKVLVLVGTLAVCGAAQAAEPSPTALEAFVGVPDTRMERETDVGSLESSDAIVKISAIVLVNEGSRPGEMRGVRFALENNTGIDTVYLDSSQLDRLRRDLNGLELGREAVHERGSDAPYKVQGTESCWNPESTNRILCPSTYTSPSGAGLTLGALYSAIFDFPNKQPRELMQLVEASLKALGETVPAIEQPHASAD